MEPAAGRRLDDPQLFTLHTLVSDVIQVAEMSGTKLTYFSNKNGFDSESTIGIINVQINDLNIIKFS